MELNYTYRIKLNYLKIFYHRVAPFSLACKFFLLHFSFCLSLKKIYLSSNNKSILFLAFRILIIDNIIITRKRKNS